MKREILFRGKRVDNNEWVYGSLIVYSVTKDGKTKKYDIKLQDAYNTNLDSYRVISETVSQFTGLTDKNGVNIFEGDIINIPYNNIGNSVVEYLSNECRYNISKYNLSEIYVIGNIHDA